MDAKIASHNKKILNEGTSTNPPAGIENCSCPKSKKKECPLAGRCLDRNIIYQAKIKNLADDSEETYIGLTATSFKERFNNHNMSLRDRNKCQTALSRCIWDMKDAGKNFAVTYCILERGEPYSPKYRSCGLCIKEKTLIITKPWLGTLNKRTELTSKCLLMDKYLLSRLK